MRLTPIFVLVALALGGCARQPVVAPSTASDVRLDGVSILGSWDAVGAPDQSDVDRDLRRGVLIRTLIVNPYNRVRLTGEDRRAGTGHVSFEGRIDGARVTFEGLPGTASVRLRNANTLEFEDPDGNRTVYRRR